MEKVIYLLWKPESVAIETFRDALLGPVAEQAFAAGAHRLVVSAADLAREIPKPTLLMGEGKTLSASFDVWLDCIDDRRPIESALHAHAARVDGYLVTESVEIPAPVSATIRRAPSTQPRTAPITAR